MARAPQVQFNSSYISGDNLMARSVGRTDLRVSDLQAAKRHSAVGGALRDSDITLGWLLEVEIRVQKRLHAIADAKRIARNR